jgi:hypothetical protein
MRERAPHVQEVVEERTPVRPGRTGPEVVLRLEAAERVLGVAVPCAAPGGGAVAARAGRPLELMELEHHDHAVPAREADDRIDLGV